MEIRDLEYFAAVAQHRHLGRAADALGITQPALSKSLGRLESSLGVKLARRSTKGVELTPEGTALQRRVHDLRLSFKSVMREVKDVSEGRSGEARIGVGPSVSETFLGDAFAAFLSEAPHVALKVTVSDNDVMVPALRRGELDLVINYSFSQSPEGMVFDPVYQLEHVVCASADHPLARRARISIKDLANERWVWPDAALLPQQRLREAFRDADLPAPKACLQCRSVGILLTTVARSDALTLISKTAMSDVARWNLKALPIPELTWQRAIGVLRRDEAYAPPAVALLIRHLKRAAKPR